MTHWQMTPEQWHDKPVPFEDFRAVQRWDDDAYPLVTFGAGALVAVDRPHAHRIANRSGENLVTLHFRLVHPPVDGYWRATHNTPKKNSLLW
ncbi:MAG: hypothetical protein AAGD25_11590 [Cyanobacteria bacterium P01_F01_bin.150]